MPRPGRPSYFAAQAAPLLGAGIGLLALACRPPPEAPTGLSDLSRYLLREWGAEDPRVLEAGIENLASELAALDLEGERADRSFAPEDLDEADIADMAHPEEPPEDCVPVGVAGMSQWEIGLHGRLQTEVDQTVAEPSASAYARRFVEPEDPDCFPDASCAVLITANDVTRSNPLYTVTMELFKDFRWIDVTSGGAPSGRRAMLARAWIAQSWDGEQGASRIVQSYTMDSWIEASDGRTWRWQVLWSESEIPGVEDEDIVAGTIRLHIDDLFEETDEAIGNLYGEEG
jgi:hypothetical protein